MNTLERMDVVRRVTLLLIKTVDDQILSILSYLLEFLAVANAVTWGTELIRYIRLPVFANKLRFQLS